MRSYTSRAVNSSAHNSSPLLACRKTLFLGITNTTPAVFGYSSRTLLLSQIRAASAPPSASFFIPPELSLSDSPPNSMFLITVSQYSRRRCLRTISMTLTNAELKFSLKPGALRAIVAASRHAPGCSTTLFSIMSMMSRFSLRLHASGVFAVTECFGCSYSLIISRALIDDNPILYLSSPSKNSTFHLLNVDA